MALSKTQAHSVNIIFTGMPHPKEDISEDNVFIGPESDDWLPLSLTD